MGNILYQVKNFYCSSQFFHWVTITFFLQIDIACLSKLKIRDVEVLNIQNANIRTILA